MLPIAKALIHRALFIVLSKDLPGGPLDLPDALFCRVLDLAHGLVPLAFGTQSVVAGQCASRLFDTSLCCSR